MDVDNNRERNQPKIILLTIPVLVVSFTFIYYLLFRHIQIIKFYCTRD